MSDRIERIEQYLRGEISSDETAAFEQQMSIDLSLAEEVRHIQILHNALEVAVEDELRARLNQIESGSRSIAPKRNTRRLYVRLAAAASFLVILGVGLWFTIGQDSRYSEFQEKHYLAFDYAQARGEYGNVALYDMNSGVTDLEEAAAWFVGRLQSHPEDHEARFIFSDILKRQNKIDDAKEQLAMIIDSQSILYGEKAEWNYVLLSATDHMDDRAIALLNKMTTMPAHSYHVQAKELTALLN